MPLQTLRTIGIALVATLTGYSLNRRTFGVVVLPRAGEAGCDIGEWYSRSSLVLLHSHGERTNTHMDCGSTVTESELSITCHCR